MERDRSRSPRGASSTEEIQKLIHMREKARLSKDWGLADNLREQLAAVGVTLLDKNHTWRAEDGRVGRIPTFSELEGGLSDLVATHDRHVSFDPNEDADGDEAQIRQMVHQRERARAAKDFQESDRIRDQLKAQGVEVFDKEKYWKQESTGLQGCILGYSGGAPTDVEITTLVKEREKARENKDYAKADMIRDDLKKFSVEIFDKEKTWRAGDGRSGHVPRWDDINGSGSTAAPPMPPMPPASHSWRGSWGASEELRGELMHTAAMACQDATIAQRCLAAMHQVMAQSQREYGVGTHRQAQPPRYEQHGRERYSQRSEDYEAAMDFILHVKAQRLSPGDSEIDWLISCREKLRFKKDFQGADDLRNAMKTSLGIELFEKEKTWQSKDGRSGSIPSFSDLGR